MKTKLRAEPKSKTELLDALAKAEYDTSIAYDQVQRILFARGWVHTSDTPGSYWVWSKRLKDGRTVLVSRDMAVQMEVHESGEEYDDHGT